ncbi:MAG: lysine--tRNA ligase [Deltaproteobacteria bacterium]|nr:MAG: lysine--tRNA ligase [Deltaproteobacteria bacterium]
MDDTNRVREDRLKKLHALRDAGINPFANDFQPSATCSEVLAEAAVTPPPDMGELVEGAATFRVGGRVMAKNRMGKAMFLRLRDRSVGNSEDDVQNLQVYAKRDVVGDEVFELLKSQVDVGDVIGVEGPLFVTRTGEPTLYVQSARLVTKSIRPLPEKYHGLSDVETRFRQRYVDLIMNPAARGVFRVRSQVIAYIRDFLNGREFVEVETPMMHPIPGGATARPFETFHNALSMPLFLRIAPELYLKRLVVGGFERVFEINRSFRNEGLSVKHNPEFTMLEFYQAYATYEDLIALTQELFSGLAAALNGDGTTTRPYGDHVIDYKAPFARYTVKESLVAIGGLTPEVVDDPEQLRAALVAAGTNPKEDLPYGLLLMLGFDALVEHHLIQPTFITQFPVEASPLARRNEADPAYTDRFELFIAGNEIANAFSELNDPIDQRGRFEAQVAARDAGDKEAMYMDLDYVRALEYGMPPAAGQGIGIDRLVMLMTNQHSIREVIFFPHMRPE